MIQKMPGLPGGLAGRAVDQEGQHPAWAGDVLDVNEAILVLAVHRRGSVSAAARELFMSQPAASRRLAATERRLGVTLFARTPSGAVPTPNGHELARASADLLARSRRAVADARDAQTQAPRLQVGVVGGEHTLSSSMMLAASVELRSVLPDARVTWRNIPFGEQRAALLDRSIDVVITVPPLRDPSIRCVPLFRERRVVVSADERMHEALPRMSSVEIAQLPLVRGPHAPEEWMAPYLLEDVRPLADAQTVVTAGATMLDVLAEAQTTLGLIVVPERVRLLLGRSTQFLVHPLTDVEPLTTSAAIQADRAADPVLRPFVGLLQHVCADDLTHHLPFAQPL